ncbi:MAG: pirin family protein [Actinobacteria bacterium]|nr:pirin family protein [Actinomycetota bacterium]
MDKSSTLNNQSSPIIQTVELGPQWPTIDPFLFCAHHDDAYPAGDENMAPRASLAGRPIGSDFSNLDGWSMYHGDSVPGFPQHPHRGFETVTYVRSGLIDHSDSMGAAARFGRGDVQWMTAGRGVVHSEMFPLVNDDAPNPTELFQIWVNLPAADKMVDPYFTMLWDEDVPRVTTTNADGKAAVVTVIAGTYADAVPGTPPPNSWAARDEADFAIWHITLEAGADLTLPRAVGKQTVRTLYVFEGDGVDVAGTAVGSATGVLVEADVDLELTASAGPVEILVLQGRPIGEPVARYGPFVMNTQQQIEEAFADYQRTQFGGWPWPEDAPAHPRDAERFARHSDGRVEAPTQR